MSSSLFDSTTVVSGSDNTSETYNTSPTERLRHEMAAVRLSFTWLGVRKSLNSHQKSQAASSFGAEGKFLSAGKKLLDTSHTAFRAVTAVRTQASNYWKQVSLPYPEPGIRLLKRQSITDFDQQMAGFQTELGQAVVELNQHYGDMVQSARERLGDLFDRHDYPDNLLGLFDIQHDYPSVEPPNYLKQLNPELYEQECQRVQARFSDAVQLAEQAFIDEFAKLVDHLSRKLTGNEDGRQQVFRNSAVTNLADFFDRFRELNVSSNEQLDELVGNVQGLMQGVKPQQLRDHASLRQAIASQMSGVQAELDQMLVDRPRRNIQRRPR